MNKFWKIYTWVYVVIITLSLCYQMVGIILGKPNHNISQLSINIAASLIPTLALYGLAYNKKILHHVFWKFILIFYLLGLKQYLPKLTGRGLQTPIFLPFYVVTLIGLSIYAFKTFTDKKNKERENSRRPI